MAALCRTLEPVLGLRDSLQISTTDLSKDLQLQAEHFPKVKHSLERQVAQFPQRLFLQAGEKLLVFTCVDELPLQVMGRLN